MTIKEKAKAYDEAIEKLRSLHDDYDTVSTLIDIKEELEDIFPELRESEDERIRIEILTYIVECSKSYYDVQKYGKEKFEKWIAWLERQVEQKYTDKVEPKFKVGDWIVRELDNTCYQIKKCILNVTNNKYGYDLTNCGYISSQDANFYHLWTIQDAKDGDVLSYRDGQWIFIYEEKIDDSSFCYHALYSTIHQDLTINDAGFTLLGDAIIPATKEQRDALMKAMTDAGYTFEFEKKELKKIEQKPVKVPKFKVGDFIQFNGVGHTRYTIKEVCGFSYYINSCNKRMDMSYTDANFELVKQKTDCGEEDETVLHNACEFIRHRMSGFGGSNGSIGGMDYKVLYEKLKSLKDRYTWKPSDEQMKALNEVLNFAANHESPHWNDYIFGTLNNLIRQLKKQKE